MGLTLMFPPWPLAASKSPHGPCEQGAQHTSYNGKDSNNDVNSTVYRESACCG